MKNDFYAEYPATGAVEFEGLRKNPPGGDPRALMVLLAQSAAMEETKRSGLRLYQDAVVSPAHAKSMAESKALAEKLGLGPPESPDWRHLPDSSFFVRIDFRLATPFLAKDDRAFWVTENPVRKDRVFGIPFISSTSWKGILRSACSRQRTHDTQEVTKRIFGPYHKPEEDFEGYRGRLRTYPSLFARIEFEMINPHDRATRTGKNPILMECVPQGEASRLAILYAPVTDGDKEKDYTSGRIQRETAEDLVVLAESCRMALLESGFSAKRSSGYGAAEPALAGRLGLLAVKLSAGVLERPFASLGDLPNTASELAREIRA